jgi:hypothetical protein
VTPIEAILAVQRAIEKAALAERQVSRSLLPKEQWLRSLARLQISIPEGEG